MNSHHALINLQDTALAHILHVHNDGPDLQSQEQDIYSRIQ